jgi:xylonate dehydratase
VVGEALGLSLPHSALAPSGQAVWLEMARASARAVMKLIDRQITTRAILTDDSIHNAMVVHAAFGGSTNLLLHIPAIAHAAGLRRPTVEDWNAINSKVPRLVSVLPNGPEHHPTVRVFLAGGVPEVMLHLRDLGLLKLEAQTVTGSSLGEMLEWWEHSDRRKHMKAILLEQDGVEASNVIFSPARAKQLGLTSTVTFPIGNLAPQGSVIKSTAIDPEVVDADGVYRKTGRARVFIRERDAVRAIKGKDETTRVVPGDVIVLICGGPFGTGMEEVYQVTSALKHLPWGKEVAVLTDARFSGVSTGACIGHIGPEALAGGPIGKVLDGDVIEIIIDRLSLTGTVNLVGENGVNLGILAGTKILEARALRTDLSAHPDLPDDTRLWAAMQGVSGGTWGGCVFDVDSILAALTRPS